MNKTPYILVLAMLLLNVSACKLQTEKKHNAVPGVTAGELSTNLEKEQGLEMAKAESKYVKDALVVIDETRKSLTFLQDKKKKEALGALEKVIGKLELLLAIDPKIALIPVNSDATTENLIADIRSIEAMRHEAQSLINKGYFQAARNILNGMSSEIRVRTYNLPLETYPAAIKEAVKLITNDKFDDAKMLLQRTLTTLVIVEDVIPIPVINAQFMVARAKDIADGNTPDKLDESKKKEIFGLLAGARAELKLAEALGYGRENRDFGALDAHIKEIEGKIKDKIDTQQLFDALTKHLNVFRDDIVKNAKIKSESDNINQ